MLHLRSITKDNWKKALSLRVRDDQVNFIATNVFSLAQLNFLDNFHAKGIYYDAEMIGFTLYGIDEEDQEYWIYRFMLDQNYQGKGYAKPAIKLILDDISSMKKDSHHTITLSYEPTNEHAKRFYEKAGFKEIEGFIIDKEQVARFTF